MRSPRVLDVVFPHRCAGCGTGPWPFCDVCRSALIVLEPPWCERCGRPCTLAVPRCRDCPPSPVASARAPFLYEGPAREAIRRLKYKGWRDIAAALAAAIVETPGLPSADAITWVPLARRRRAERGYDQARALAVAVARLRGVPAVRLLRRRVATRPQARRSGDERRSAMQGAFEPTGGAPSSVVLVDDVLTTGATAAACAEALTAAGARRVHVVAAARAFHPAGGQGHQRGPGIATLHGSAAHAYPRVGSRSGLWLPGDVPR